MNRTSTLQTFSNATRTQREIADTGTAPQQPAPLARPSRWREAAKTLCCYFTALALAFALAQLH